MTYAIQIKKNAQRSLARIPRNYQENIIAAIRNLSNDPFPQGCKKLSGREVWRIRIGSYRILYEMDGNELLIIVVNIDHRREVYKQKS